MMICFQFIFIVWMQNWKLKFKLVMVLSTLGLITFLLISLTSLVYYKKRRFKKRTSANEFIWEKNSLYDSNQSIDSKDEYSELPGWLKDRKEMIFSEDSITKGKQLGKGQFGAVFKGQLSQGNAV